MAPSNLGSVIDNALPLGVCLMSFFISLLKPLAANWKFRERRCLCPVQGLIMDLRLGITRESVYFTINR
jgi:hypothetical protein